jgi:hypothetical protein
VVGGRDMTPCILIVTHVSSKKRNVLSCRVKIPRRLLSEKRWWWLMAMMTVMTMTINDMYYIVDPEDEGSLQGQSKIRQPFSSP